RMNARCSWRAIVSVKSPSTTRFSPTCRFCSVRSSRRSRPTPLWRATSIFALGYIAEPRTIYAHVHKLAAGSTLLIRRGQTPELRTYWDPHPAEIPKGELATLEESLIDRLGAIVKSQLVADVPVGAFVSGGVDSSGTMALMARASADPITAFSIGFNDDAFDETRFARQVAQRYHA